VPCSSHIVCHAALELAPCEVEIEGECGMHFLKQVVAPLALCAGLALPAHADTVRGGSVVLLTSASQGSGDSVCQASPRNERKCERAERKYDRTVKRIERTYDKKVENRQAKRDRQLDKADSRDEKLEIRQDHQDDIERLRNKRDKQLAKAQAEL
jgi:hypothetical protein